MITEFEPKTQPKDIGWTAVGGRYAEKLLVEKPKMDLYIDENPKFIEQMRTGKVALGMTEHQTRLAWGMSTSSLKKIAGYEKVNIYRETSNSQNLYFMDGRLALIK